MATGIAKRRERGEAGERRGPHKQTAPLTSISGSYVFSLKVRRGGSCLKPSVTAYRAACYESLKDVGAGREDETVPHLKKKRRKPRFFNYQHKKRRKEDREQNRQIRLLYFRRVWVSAAARWEAGGRGVLFKGSCFAFHLLLQ
jgi:hypothetical protein